MMVWLAAAALLHAEDRLGFEEMEKTIQAPNDARSVTVDFPFTNTSDERVTIQKYDGGCTCMTVQVANNKLSYLPGESGVIRAVFDMGNFSGTVDKMVALWLDGDPAGKPSVHLKVRVHIPVLVELEPKTLRWDVGASADPQTIQIRMNGEKPIKILSVSSTQTSFKHELKVVEEGKSYELTVTPDSTDSPGLTIIRVETDCEIARHKIAQAFGVIRAPLPGEQAARP